jgi:hypothetical protein
MGYKLSSIELIIMATSRCAPVDATAEYRRIEAELINLEIPCALAAGTVLATTLIVRALPNATSASLGKLAKGAPLTVWGRAGQPPDVWLCVQDRTGAQAGWVSARWVQEG